MSLDASGSIAGTITFSKWKGRNYVRQLVTPANPKSALQVSTRAMMRFLSQRWTPDLSALNKASWDDDAAALAVSPFNAYIKTNLSRWTQFTTPSYETPVAGVGAPSTFITPATATGQVGQASIAWDLNALNDGWGLLIFRSATTGFTPGRDTLIGVGHLLTLTADTFIDTGLAAGTWFYNAQAFTTDGVLSAAQGETTATVT